MERTSHRLCALIPPIARGLARHKEGARDGASPRRAPEPRAAGFTKEDHDLDATHLAELLGKIGERRARHTAKDHPRRPRERGAIGAGEFEPIIDLRIARFRIEKERPKRRLSEAPRELTE